METSYGELVAEINQLRSELGAMRAGAHGGSIDLVKLDDIHVYMPTNDNLYERFVPFSCRKQPRNAEILSKDLYKGIDTDPANCLLKYIEVIHNSGFDVELYDVGSWVGDIAIKLAKFAKAKNIRFRSECYDPSFAGSLVPFNASLNGVSDLVHLNAIGLSVNGGPQLFIEIAKNSDASRLDSIGPAPFHADTHLINTKTLKEIISDSNAKSHEIIKIDVEGIDGQAILDNFDRVRNSTLIMEFSPNQEQYENGGPAAFLETMRETHLLFDICYAPRPSFIREVVSSADLVQEVLTRRYQYTDVLMVPKSLNCHDDIVTALGMFEARPLSFMMAEGEKIQDDRYEPVEQKVEKPFWHPAVIVMKLRSLISRPK